MHVGPLRRRIRRIDAGEIAQLAATRLVETDADCAVGLRLAHVQIHTQAGNRRSLGEKFGVWGERVEMFLGGARLTRRVFAFRPAIPSCLLTVLRPL